RSSARVSRTTGVRSKTENPEKGNQRCRNRRDQLLRNVPGKRPGKKNSGRKQLVACNPKNARYPPVSETQRKTPILPESVQVLNRCLQSGIQVPAVMKRRNR